MTFFRQKQSIWRQKLSRHYFMTIVALLSTRIMKDICRKKCLLIPHLINSCKINPNTELKQCWPENQLHSVLQRANSVFSPFIFSLITNGRCNLQQRIWCQKLYSEPTKLFQLCHVPWRGDDLSPFQPGCTWAVRTCGWHTSVKWLKPTTMAYSDVHPCLPWV